MKSWKLHLEGLGKIKKADIDVSGFNLFIGDNNSGKSYIMTIIYALLNVRFFFQKYKIDTDSKEYQECKSIVRVILQDNSFGYFRFNENMIMSFNQLLNRILEENKELFIRNFFNKKIPIEKISVEILEKQNRGVRFEREYESDKIILYFLNIIQNEAYELTGIAINKDLDDNDCFFVISYIMECLLKVDYSSMYYSDIIYLPTSRTGFLLTYKTLASSSIEDKYNIGAVEKNLLTKPCSDFLVKLAKAAGEDWDDLKYSEIITYIERKIIEGHIDVDNSPSSNIMYTPRGKKEALPMHVTSGVVTEVTPLLLMLENCYSGTILIEEPEMCLHPELQREMARVLIKIYNTDTPIFITTHSDIILGHINNMIQLNGKENKKELLEKLNYDNDDLISSDDIEVYQFTVKDNETKIERLKCGTYGFHAPTFHNALQDMLEQTENINEGD